MCLQFHVITYRMNLSFGVLIKEGTSSGSKSMSKCQPYSKQGSTNVGGTTPYNWHGCEVLIYRIHVSEGDLDPSMQLHSCMP